MRSDQRNNQHCQVTDLRRALTVITALLATREEIECSRVGEQGRQRRIKCGFVVWLPLPLSDAVDAIPVRLRLTRLGPITRFSVDRHSNGTDWSEW